MNNFVNFLEQNLGEGGELKSTIYFEQWLNNKSKLDSINEITYSSDLCSDWKWIHRNAFDLKCYYETSTILFICDVFIDKWINSVQDAGTHYRE